MDAIDRLIFDVSAIKAALKEKGFKIPEPVEETHETVPEEITENCNNETSEEETSNEA